MKLNTRFMDNQDGSVLIIALLMLVAVTALGFFSTTTSTIESQVTANNNMYKKAFYAAEAGLERARVVLSKMLVDNNQSRMASSGKAFYTFALDGSQSGVNAASLNSDDRPDFENGAVWYGDPNDEEVRVSIGDSEYRVILYDDLDGDDDATIDSNGTIWARSEGFAPGGAKSVIELLLGNFYDEEAIQDYTAQSGAGAVKSSEGGDKEGITNFTTQAGGLGT